MKKANSMVLLKMGVIAVVMVVLLAPTNMVLSLIGKREQMAQISIDEVSEKWGKAQTLVGPVISVPYYSYPNQNKTHGARSTQRDQYGEVIIDFENESNKTSSTKKVKEYIHFLPSTLNITTTIVPEIRLRGIYEVVVYKSVIKFSGTFKNVEFDTVGVSLKDVLLDQAHVSVGVSELKGLENRVDLIWNNTSIPFGAGLKTKGVMNSGISTSIGIPLDHTTHNFSFDIVLKGSQQLYFVPIGEVTNVTMNSTWNTPSFTGEFLPDSRTVNTNGFSAHWNILYLNRNFPQAWSGNMHAQAVYNSAFGTELLLPMDNYSKPYRSIEYAILFIALTFFVCFFVESSSKILIHPVQYILVGLALLVFYLLLLALSEYIGFDLAFMVSALITLLLIGVHMYSLLRLHRVTILIIGILVILYGFVFLIIQLQDHALLAGSIGMVVILATVMYFARKIDWYADRLN